jgi:hypothetical protein
MASNYVAVAATITTGNLVSTAICIAEYPKVYIDCPTWSVGCTTANVSLAIDGCDTSDGTFRPVYAMGVASAASGGVLWEMLSNTGNCLCAFDPPTKPKFIKARLGGPNTATANVLCRVVMYHD